MKDNRGGYRPGSGRKPANRIRRTVAFDEDINEWLTSREYGNDYINQSLRKEMNKENKKNENKMHISKAQIP